MDNKNSTNSSKTAGVCLALAAFAICFGISFLLTNLILRFA